MAIRLNFQKALIEYLLNIVRVLRRFVSVLSDSGVAPQDIGRYLLMVHFRHGMRHRIYFALCFFLLLVFFRQHKNHLAHSMDSARQNIRPY
jgi:hypothetical protein